MKNKLLKIINTLLITFVSLLLLNTPSYAVETTTYYHHDGLGSAIAASDVDGNLLWREDYQPYGTRVRNPGNAGDNTLWFTGKPEEPSLGLQYFGARWYDPVAGRFTGIDPVGVIPENIHTFNRYSYAANSPYVYVDPDGKAFFTAMDVRQGESLNASVQRNSPGNAAVVTGGAGVLAVIAVYLGFRSGGAAVKACTGPCSAAAIAYGTSATANDLPSVAKGPKVGGGANLKNLSPGEQKRIQNAADKSGADINVVGSQTTGSRPASDFDFILEGGTSRSRSRIKNSLPSGPRGTGEGNGRDFLEGPVDKSRPFITFEPKPKG